MDVFADRAHAGRVLADLMRPLAIRDPLLLAIPAGGVPVAAAMARALGWPLDVAVVSKITLPWNTESGYGAVAFDGSVLLNDALAQECALSPEQIADGIAATRRKVERRVKRLRAGLGPLVLADKQRGARRRRPRVRIHDARRGRCVSRRRCRPRARRRADGSRARCRVAERRRRRARVRERPRRHAVRGRRRLRTLDRRPGGAGRARAGEPRRAVAVRGSS